MRIALIALLCSLFAAPLSAQQLSVGAQAPEFQATMADDSSTSVQALAAERPTVVLFWASWCPYCKALMPHLQSILDEYGSDRVEVVAVAIREDDPADAIGFLQAQNYDFLRVGDGEAVAESWGVGGVPRLYLLDAEGRIVYDQASQRSAPKRRFAGDQAKKHSARAAMAAPSWAAALRQAIDAQISSR